jgi:glucose-1-phosphate cytidylyltransferase
MKVVIFCGGLGLRMREAGPSIPKPMVPLGQRPILWHIMKYYAHFGHRDFILCLGHQADAIKTFFLEYKEALVNDFVMSNGGASVELLRSDIRDWRITFVDTGLKSNIGQRLRLVRRHLGDDEMFLATYGDGVTDAPLPDVIERIGNSGAAGGMLCVRPRSYSFHSIVLDQTDRVTQIEDVTQSDIWINGGFFVFRNEIFHYMQDGEELLEEPFQRLMQQGRLLGYRYEGFWAPMDTLKDKNNLEAMIETGNAPWRVWDNHDFDHDPEPVLTSVPC